MKKDITMPKKTMKKLLLAAGAAKRRNPVRGKKAIMARNTSQDAWQFIDRFDALNNDAQNMQDVDYAAKAVVDLCVSIESSLKSLIICLSPDKETPAELYKNLKRVYGHKLKKLHDEVISRAKNKKFKIQKNKKRVFNRLEKLEYINSRYSQEIWKFIQDEKPYKKYKGYGEMRRTVGDGKWRKSVRAEAVRLWKLQNKCYKQFLFPHAMAPMNVSIKEMKELLKDIR